MLVPALILSAVALSAIAWAMCKRGAEAQEPSDDFARRLADADDAWLTAMARQTCADISAPDAGVSVQGGNHRGAAIRRFSLLSHGKSGDSACPRQ